MEYDFLIVGAGLFGATFAHKATQKGKSCLVIDRRPHIAGNAYTEFIDGINVHKYGAHIFHTNDADVWMFVRQFADFNNYVNSPIANYDGELYNLPFNMNTFYKLWGAKTPLEAIDCINKQRIMPESGEARNLKEQALSLVGTDIYEKLIKGYTEKQWGRPCEELPSSIIKRIPLRFIYDNNYFSDRWQGVPIGGYTKMVENMLTGSDVQLGTSFDDLPQSPSKMASTIIHTGCKTSFLIIVTERWNIAL